MANSRLSPLRRTLAALLMASDAVSAVTFAIAAPVVIGFTGLGVEVGSWYVYQRRLQNAADLSAVAGAVEVAYASEDADTETLARTTVSEEVGRNGINVDGLGTLSVSTPPADGSHTGDTNAVEVILERQYNRNFSSVFATDPVTIHVRAVATTDYDGNHCVLALSKTADGAVTFSGSSIANLGCGVASNSTSSTSVLSQGSASAHVSGVRASGGISNSGGLVSETAPHANANPVKDPYADLSAPTVSSCTFNNKKVTTKPPTTTLSPGTYCNGLDIGSHANVTLKPGTYVIADKDFSVGAGATITGAGVTIILTTRNGTDYSEIKFNGSATIDLSAPTTGPYAGILIFQDPNAPVSTSSSYTHKLNGDAGSKLVGVIHIPNQPVEMSGNATVPNGCLRVIAQTVTFTGNFTLPTQCTDPAYKKIAGVRVSLVE
jgi:Flp pilus assembly protein TadG